MTALFVITCEPTDAAPSFSVWLSDGLAPGIHVADCASREAADRLCVLVAIGYRCRALPLVHA